jgi:hypothetical protein
VFFVTRCAAFLLGTPPLVPVGIATLLNAVCFASSSRESADGESVDGPGWSVSLYTGTAVHCAALTGNTSALSMLLGVEGVDVNDFHGPHGRSPIHIAALSGR